MVNIRKENGAVIIFELYTHRGTSTSRIIRVILYLPVQGDLWTVQNSTLQNQRHSQSLNKNVLAVNMFTLKYNFKFSNTHLVL